MQSRAGRYGPKVMPRYFLGKCVINDIYIDMFSFSMKNSASLSDSIAVFSEANMERKR